MSCLNDCKQTVSRFLPISATQLRWQSTPRVCWTPISGRKFPCQSLTGGSLDYQPKQWHHWEKKNPQNYHTFASSLIPTQKQRGIFSWSLWPTDCNQPTPRLPWDSRGIFTWKHFPYLFRMKSYHWQKMNNSFKIVAKTVKLVPLQKKTFLGGEISKKKLPSTKNSAATTNNTSKVPVYWNVSPPAVFVESYKDHSEPPNVDPRFPPRNGKNCLIFAVEMLSFLPAGGICLQWNVLIKTSFLWK